MTARRFLLPNVICTTLLAVNCTHAQGLQPVGVRKSVAQKNEIKLIIPFAVPLGVPVAPFAPYFYSYQATRFHSASKEDAKSPNCGNTSAAVTTHQSPLTPVSPLIATHCAACHGGPSPKGNLSLDQLDKLSPDVRLKGIRAVLSGRMPIGETLAPSEVHSLIQEFTNLNRSDAEAQR
jgi:hypothetical protein